ncbi:MAG: two pore domain potassium channel family protein [Rhodobacteraceae bacterium]|nr:two pore domain potassium channel family protein [Paracoccaceae bacterium]
MLVQLAIGTALILCTVVVAGAAYWLLEAILTRLHPWLRREPHGPKLMLVLCVSVTWVLMMMTSMVWIWAFAFLLLDIFVTLEASVYFALVAFTTLGFGDLLLPVEWRLLGGMAAANGFLSFGLMTAMMVEVLRDVRHSQAEMRRGR